MKDYYYFENLYFSIFRFDVHRRRHRRRHPRRHRRRQRHLPFGFWLNRR